MNTNRIANMSARVRSPLQRARDAEPVGPLPNFLIIGAMKAGTTSLYHYLGAHPQIYMPAFKAPELGAEFDGWGIA